MELMIKAGGIYNIALVIFHLLFWRIFNWQEDLRSLTFLNRAIMPVLKLRPFLLYLALALGGSAATGWIYNAFT